MPADFIPANDQAFSAWVANFSSIITANPVSVGLTAAIATTLAGKVTTYQTALEAATEPSTRGGSTILARQLARADLEPYCRQLARAIQGTLTVTDQQRYDLGLTVRDVEPTPVPPPSSAPGVEVVSVSGNTVRLRLKDTANPTRRGRPAGVAGAAIFSHVGPAAPATVADWTFEANTARTIADVTFPAETPAGSRVWFCAFWFNAKMQAGVACAPVGTNLPGGASMAA